MPTNFPQSEKVSATLGREVVAFIMSDETDKLIKGAEIWVTIENKLLDLHFVSFEFILGHNLARHIFT